MKMKLLTALVQHNPDDSYSQYSDGEMLEWDDAEALRYMAIGAAEPADDKAKKAFAKAQAELKAEAEPEAKPEAQAPAEEPEAEAEEDEDEHSSD
jgi:hypothetical protein